MSSPRVLSSAAMAIHMPSRPSGFISISARPMRTTHIVARFMTLGTSVSPAPRRAPAATIDAPKSGKQLYPKHLRGKLAHGGIGREHGEQQRAYEHHYKPQYAHYGCAHANAYVAIAAGKLILARAHAAAYDRCGSGAYSVAGHVA